MIPFITWLPSPSPSPFSFLLPQCPQPIPQLLYCSHVSEFLVPISKSSSVWPWSLCYTRKKILYIFQSLRNLNIYDVPHQDVLVRKCNSCHLWLLKNYFLDTLVAPFIFWGWQIMELQVPCSNLLILFWFLETKKKKNGTRVKPYGRLSGQGKKICLYCKKLCPGWDQGSFIFLTLFPFVEWEYQ